MKDQNHMIISVVAEKALTRFNIPSLGIAFNKPSSKPVFCIIFVWLCYHKCAFLS